MKNMSKFLKKNILILSNFLKPNSIWGKFFKFTENLSKNSLEKITLTFEIH